MPWTAPRLRASVGYWRKRERTARRARRHARRMIEKRKRQLDALKHGPGAAVTWALNQVGTVEHPAGSNRGPKISDWIKATGYGFGVPWCQCFANAVAVHGGAPQLKDGYTPTVLNSSHPGFRRVRAADAAAGDFVFFKFPGVSSASCDHVGVLLEPPANGVVKAVEGNTSSGTAGSQNNGGGVFVRTRSQAIVAGYVRPPYPKG